MPASQERPLARTPAPVARLLVPLLGVVCVLPWTPSSVALLLGIGVALVFGNPWAQHTPRLARSALAWSVVGLGAGMDLGTVARVGLQGALYTAFGITFTLALGHALGRLFGVPRTVSALVSVGTAICGGSAIAATAPVLRAKDGEVSMAMITVFVLNAIALWVFPWVGRALQLDQEAFGLWCALAIHDTSSVVGAAASYGERALEVATAAKLTRALWIVPLTVALAGWCRARRSSAEESPMAPSPRPWFIAGFLVMATVTTFVPGLRAGGQLLAAAAHRLLAVTLFLLGLGLSRAALRNLGLRSLLQATSLWLTTAGLTLWLIVRGWLG